MREENCQICGSYSCDGNPCEEDELRKNAQKDSPTPEQTLERLKEDDAKEFYLKFVERFIEIAKMADMGDDVGYGKGLVKLEIDIRNYHLEKLEKTWQACKQAVLEDVVDVLEDLRPHKANQHWTEEESGEDLLLQVAIERVKKIGMTAENKLLSM